MLYEACDPAAIAAATILVPSQVVKSLQLISRLGTRRWNLRVPNLQMSYSDLNIGYQIVCSGSQGPKA